MRQLCKRAAVIGGGFSGLGAVKMLKEDGIEPTCFEKSNSVGGSWNYREETMDGLGSVMWTTITITSKEFIFSDRLLPKETPNFMRHSELYEHFMRAVDKHQLMQHVICNREVLHVERTSDYEETGRWTVTVRNTKDGSVSAEDFDAVLVCVGLLAYPKMSNFPSMNKFSGAIMHTHGLKKVDMFYGQKVVVVGAGCSALDAAVAISNVAKQVYLSVRTPPWILSRTGKYGLPSDFLYLRRHFSFIQDFLPPRLSSWLSENSILDLKFSHQLYGIEPTYNYTTKDIVANDEIFQKLSSGTIILKNDIQEFTETGVIFNDETEVTECNTIIMATGYTYNFSFLEEGIVERGGKKCPLYKCMYPAHLPHPTLAIIGVIRPIGSGFPIGELQIRWAVHLLATGKPLPNAEIMLKDATDRCKANRLKYVPADHMEIRVKFIPYCDELAREIGAMPNFWRMAFTDARLFFACIFGPCVPYQYRLIGPHKWYGARKAILTCSERVQAPLSGKRLNRRTKTKEFYITNILIPLSIICLLFFTSSALKYYISVLPIAYHLINSKYISTFFFFLPLLLFFLNYHGFIAIYLLTVVMFLYCNLDIFIVNKKFWV